MAIKITGTTVINDSRGLDNITGINQIVRAPEIVSPTNNETDVDFSGLTIEGGGYNAVFSNNRDYREFQVDLATGDFSTPVISQQVNSDSLTLSTDLVDDTQHKVRIRDVDLDGTVGPFSNVVNFTTVENPLANPTPGLAAEGTCSFVDGYANTYPALENSTHPAGNWTATRTIDGFSDWYLPAIDELDVIYNNGGGNGSGDPLPSGEDFATDGYWSSTEGSSCCACCLAFGFGLCRSFSKAYANRVRAVRRVPI